MDSGKMRPTGNPESYEHATDTFDSLDLIFVGAIHGALRRPEMNENVPTMERRRLAGTFS